jgi:hypothetical protein
MLSNKPQCVDPIDRQTREIRSMRATVTTEPIDHQRRRFFGAAALAVAAAEFGVSSPARAEGCQAK